MLAGTAPNHYGARCDIEALGRGEFDPTSRAHIRYLHGLVPSLPHLEVYQARTSQIRSGQDTWAGSPTHYFAIELEVHQGSVQDKSFDRDC